MEVLNLFSVILDLLAWTALIRLLYCPGLKFDLRFWSYITLIAVIEQIFVYQDKILAFCGAQRQLVRWPAAAERR